MNGSGVGRLFNSPLEAGIRAVFILENLRPEAMDLNDLILLDYLVVHTADIGGPESLHPEIPNKEGELLVRRRLIENSLDLMHRCHLVERHLDERGVTFSASDEARNFLEVMETGYATRLKERAHWLAETFLRLSADEFRRVVGEKVGAWSEAFTRATAGPTAN